MLALDERSPPSRNRRYFIRVSGNVIQIFLSEMPVVETRLPSLLLLALLRMLSEAP